MPLGDMDEPPARRFLPATRDVTPETDENTATGGLSGAVRSAIDRKGLRRRTKVKPHASRHSHRTARPIDGDHFPPGDFRESNDGGSGTDRREITVVAE